MLLCTLFCLGSLLSAGTALAFSQRTHVFASSFGAPGPGLGQLRKPGAVAVSESTGDVYVADRQNNRIDQFGPNGAPIAVWGVGVSDGAETFEVCTSPGPCKAGTGKTAVAPGAIAVDNSAGPSKGDVYAVIDPRAENGVLWKLTASGEKIAVLEQEGVNPWQGALDGVAVDGSGTLWVYRGTEEGSVERFTGAENKFTGSPLAPSLESEALSLQNEGEAVLCPKPGFAVDHAGEHLYINHERLNAEEGCPAQKLAEEKIENIKPPKETLRSVVTAPFTFKVNGAEESLEVISTALESQNTGAVAVDQASSASTPLGQAARGDSYLANGATVAAFDPSRELIQRIELPGGAPRAGGVAIESSSGALYVADSTDGRIDVFHPAASGSPIVDGVFPQDQTPTSTKLIARIDPNGAATAYSIQYGTIACISEPAACTTAHGAAELPAVFGDLSAEVELTGLQPDTTYYYRVVAENVHGKVESARSTETFFTTLPSAEGVLSDHRQWQLVSPPKKGGPFGLPDVQDPAAIQAADGGAALAYGAPNSAPSGEPEGSRSKQATQFLFTRGETEWQTQDITTPHNKAEGFITEEPPEYQLFSSDLSLGIVEPEAKLTFPLESPPLSPPLQEEQREKTIYLRHDAPISPGPAEKASSEEAAQNSGYLAPGYLPLITKLNDTANNPFGSGLQLLNATPDANHVVFRSTVGLTKNAEGEAFAGEGLYEWNSTSPEHALQLVSVLPGGEAPASEPHLGGLGVSRNAISEDGSHIFFTSTVGTNEAARLFMRRTTSPTTSVTVSAAEAGVSEPGEADLENSTLNKVQFETASRDGSRVFFKDTWPLTKDSTLDPKEREPQPSDLYEFNTETGKLADLTVPHPGETAGVLGTIPGAAEDGSNVYFVANGILAPGATRGHCAEEAGGGATEGSPTCNLYVSSPDPEHAGQRVVRLIATLSANDVPDWSAPEGPRGSAEGTLAFVTSRVSPNGRRIAFMSERSLTGYNNEDVTSKAPGERLDEEVYVYDTALGRLVCASCTPGARPAGVFDRVLSEEQPVLLADPSGLWRGHWLAGSIPAWTPNRYEGSSYQPRYLLDNGRLFFDSPDALVEGDKNQVEDTYQYEPEGVGTCQHANGCVALISSGSASDNSESVFLDASVNGNDVFFLTAGKLLSQDVDSTFDIYDASVCGTSESPACLPVKPPPALECVGEACKAPAPGQQQFATPQSQTFSGPGNTPGSGVLPNKANATPKPLTRAQKLAKALKTCRKVKHKKPRAACEKRARKQFGVKAKAKKTKGTKSSARRRAR